MGSLRPGRWIAAALVAGCIVLGSMIACDELDLGTPSRLSNPTSINAGPAAPAPRRRHHDAEAPAAREPGAAVILHVFASEDGSPIAGATVIVPGATDATLRETTGADGTARFPRLVAHDWRFEASAPGRLARVATVMAIDGCDTPLEIALDPAALLQVRVEDEKGAAVAADLEVQPLGGGPKVTAKIDPRRPAEFAVPTDTIVRVRASRAQVGETEVVVRSPASGAKAVTLRLSSQFGTFTGTVRDPAGAPVPRAVVLVAHAATPISSGDISTVRTRNLERRICVQADAAGRFTASPLALGERYHAAAAEANRSFARCTELAEDIVPTEASPDVHRDLVLLDYGTIVVRVVDSLGAAVSDADMSVSECVEGVFHMPRSAQFDTIPPGRHTVTARSARGVGHAVIDVLSGETVHVTVHLEPLQEISGTVVDDRGRAVADATVDLSSREDRFVGFRTKSGADGAWRLAGVPGESTLAVNAPGCVALKGIAVRVPSEDCRLVLGRAATITGRLVPPGQERPASANVRLGAHDRSAPCAADGTFHVEFDPANVAQVRILFGSRLTRPAGPMTRLEIIDVEYAPIVRTIDPHPGSVEDLGDLLLARPSKLRGRVVDAQGRPVPEAALTIDGAGSSLPVWFPKPTTDARGEFAFDCAPSSGLVPLRIAAEGFLDGRAEVIVPSAQAPVITLRRGGLVWGEVVEAGGAPIADARVKLVDATGADREILANAHGHFAVRVPAGRASVSVGASSVETVDVGEGADAHVRIVASIR